MGMGWQLQHHTHTCVHRTHSGYGYTPYPYVCGVVEQLQVSWNPQFFSSYQCQAEGALLPTHTYITVHPFPLNQWV